jgi:hypothetical protein
MYIVDREKQRSLIREMKQLRQNTKNYEVYYHHSYTNQMWKSFYPQARDDELGPKLLRHEPVPADVEERLNICLGEQAAENAVGLGIEWSARPELWPMIIQCLEKRYTSYDRTQISLFLNNLQLDERSAEQLDQPNLQGETSFPISTDTLNNLIWRCRKLRMKRFFVLG